MLRIYSDAIEMCREAAVVAKVIEKSDGDLARQLRRAASGVALNIAEGSSSLGGNRRARYFSAMGSAREVGACFDVAMAMAYVDRIDTNVRERLNAILGTLVKVTRLRQ